MCLGERTVEYQTVLLIRYSRAYTLFLYTCFQVTLLKDLSVTLSYTKFGGKKVFENACWLRIQYKAF